jgi:hypothetical protein
VAQTLEDPSPAFGERNRVGREKRTNRVGREKGGDGKCGICRKPLPPYSGRNRPRRYHEACLAERDERYNAARRLGERQRSCLDCSATFTFKHSSAVRCPACRRRRKLSSATRSGWSEFGNDV